MRHSMVRAFVFTVFLSLGALLSIPAHAAMKVALVVGNSMYRSPGLALSNPRNDAADLAALLRTLGFQVIEAIDVDKRGFDAKLQTFARAATNADSILFFYAGHALQHQGRNYLMPIDVELEDEVSLRYQTVSLDDVRSALDRTSGVKIMILDACRNNPLASRLEQRTQGANRSLGKTRGLARADITQGMVVSYATAADEVAQDGTGRNSPFASALLSRLKEPGLEVELMFRRVTSDVNKQTGGRQRPETHVSLLGEYYLNETDQLSWEQIKDTGDPAKLRDFIARFPSSPRALAAQNRLDALDRAAQERRLESERREAAELRSRVAELERLRLQAPAAQPSSQVQADAERTRLAALEHEVCRREADWLARLVSYGAADDLVRFEGELSCQSLRPAAQAAIARAALADTPHLVMAAQAELGRMGCYRGAATGHLNDLTRQALRRYADERGSGPLAVKVTAALVAELKNQPDHSCVPEPRVQTQAAASATARSPGRCKDMLQRAMLGDISPAERQAMQTVCK